jgi:hypothetical protein
VVNGVFVEDVVVNGVLVEDVGVNGVLVEDVGVNGVLVEDVVVNGVRDEDFGVRGVVKVEKSRFNGRAELNVKEFLINFFRILLLFDVLEGVAKILC